MEILFVSHKYPPATGGMEKQSFELINGMQEHLTVHRIVYEGRGSRLSFFLQLNRRIKEACKENPGITVIHFNDGLMAACCLLHRGYDHLKKTVTVHGLDVVYPNFYYQRFILPAFNRFDLIIAVSKATADACISRNIAKEKIVVINNGVDTQVRPTASRQQVEALFAGKYQRNIQNRRLLVVMGRPVKRKGFSWFIQNVLPGLNEDFLLLIIGPVSKKNRGNRFLQLLPAFIKTPAELFLGAPSDEQHIEKLIAQPCISKKVFRMGKLPFDEITSILSISDAFLMPNIPVTGDMEGFGLVCLEAVMCGANVYAAASGGITDAIHPGKNGTLLPPADHAAWIDAINNELEPRETTSYNANQAIAFTRENFSWKKTTGQYLTCFLEQHNSAY